MNPALGPILLALARGELNLLWSFTDAPPDEDKLRSIKADLDETIEPPSEAAMRGREITASQEIEEDIGAQSMEKEGLKDDSWMDGSVGIGNGTDGKVRKRKGGAKKK